MYRAFEEEEKQFNVPEQQVAAAPLAPRMASPRPMQLPVAPPAAPVLNRNVQAPLVPSANRPRPLSPSMAVPLAPNPGASTENPSFNINLENAARQDMDKYSNEAFNKWYATQDPGTLKQFAAPPGQMSSLKIVNSQGQESGISRHATEPAVLQQMQREQARKHFNSVVLGGDQRYQGLQAAHQMARTARMTRVPLAQLQQDDQRNRAAEAVIAQSQAETGLTNAKAETTLNPRETPETALQREQMRERNNLDRERLTLEGKRLDGELALGGRKLDTDRQIADGRAKSALEVEKARQARLAQQKETEAAQKAAEVEERQAQSEYDDARQEYFRVATEHTHDPTNPELVAAREKMAAAFRVLEPIQKNRLSALRGGAPNSPTAPTRTGAAPSDIAATQPAQPGRGRPQAAATQPAQQVGDGSGGFPAGNGQKLMPGQHDEIARMFLNAAKGDPNRARQLAATHGWTL
jgi:hypothetical protein